MAKAAILDAELKLEIDDSTLAHEQFELAIKSNARVRGIILKTACKS